VRIDVLGSGSRGNAVVIDGGDDTGALLVDCGFGPRTLAARLRAVGLRPQQISDVVLTHEHSDHVCGALKARRRWNWRLSATAGTTRTTPGLADAVTYRLSAGRRLRLAGLSVETVRTPHDAAESVALVVTHEKSGARVGLVWDLGHWTASIAAHLQRLDALVVETNHDPEMLRTGPYPPFLQARVAGRHGHLSNDEGAALAAAVAHRGLRTVVAAHLSEQNNLPSLALGVLRHRLTRSRFGGAVHAARQDAALTFEVGRPRRATQLALDL
jgi:phosphoribosyl 1,2-cyclic phosphodiesterase